VFGTTCIIGLGALGGSFAAALRMYASNTRIIGISRQSTLDAAIAKNLIHEGFCYDDMDEAVSRADLTILCTPVNIIIEHLPRIMQAAKAGALVTDVGSTKARIQNIAAECRTTSEAWFLGGHPMAGSEQRGVHVSNAVMFRDRPWVLIEDETCSAESAEQFRTLVASFGAKVVRLTVAEHDRFVAAVSHLPQLTAVALMNLVGGLAEQSSDIAKVTGQGFADMTRIASSPFDVWRDICATNADNITAQLDQLIAMLSEIRDQVGGESLGKQFEQAQEYRRQLTERK
jgi:prephenate dehydrogenase